MATSRLLHSLTLAMKDSQKTPSALPLFRSSALPLFRSSALPLCSRSLPHGRADLRSAPPFHSDFRGRAQRFPSVRLLLRATLKPVRRARTHLRRSQKVNPPARTTFRARRQVIPRARTPFCGTSQTIRPPRTPFLFAGKPILASRMPFLLPENPPGHAGRLFFLRKGSSCDAEPTRIQPLMPSTASTPSFFPYLPSPIS